MESDHLQSCLEGVFPPEESLVDPVQTFADPYRPSNASVAWPSSAPTSASRMNYEVHNSKVECYLDARYVDLAAGLDQMDELGWHQCDYSARSYNGYHAQNGQSAFDACGNDSLSSRARAIWETPVSLLGTSNYDQFAFVPPHYDTSFDPALFSNPCSVSSMLFDDIQSSSNSVYRPVHDHNFGPEPHTETRPWSRPDDSMQLLVNTGSHLYHDLEAVSNAIPGQHDMELEPCWSETGTATFSDTTSNVPYEPESKPPQDASTILSCSYDGCSVPFKNVADRKRHLNTIHNQAGQSYMCAHAGCVRAFKVWNRLDSFKNHAKLHNPGDIDSLINSSADRSRKERKGLRVAVTTQAKFEKMQIKRAVRSSVQMT